MAEQWTPHEIERPLDVFAGLSTAKRVILVVTFYEFSVALVATLVWLIVPIPFSVIYLISSMVMLAVSGFLLGRLQQRRRY